MITYSLICAFPALIFPGLLIPRFLLILNLSALITYSQLFANLFLNQVDQVTNCPVEISSGVHSKRKGSEGGHDNIDPEQLNGVGASVIERVTPWTKIAGIGAGGHVEPVKGTRMEDVVGSCIFFNHIDICVLGGMDGIGV